MSVVPLHRVVGTRLCKTDGCENDAAAARGPYAALCTSCAAAKKKERRERLAARADAPAAVTGPTYEQRVRDLLPFAKELDKALARYRPAKHELVEAMHYWSQAVEALTS